MIERGSRLEDTPCTSVLKGIIFRSNSCIILNNVDCFFSPMMIFLLKDLGVSNLFTVIGVEILIVAVKCNYSG